VAAQNTLERLLMEARTYAEPHFQELIRKLLVIAPPQIKSMLLVLDVAWKEP